MIPPPHDLVLLREHAYRDTGIINFVLPYNGLFKYPFDKGLRASAFHIFLLKHADFLLFTIAGLLVIYYYVLVFRNIGIKRWFRVVYNYSAVSLFNIAQPKIQHATAKPRMVPTATRECGMRRSSGSKLPVYEIPEHPITRSRSRSSSSISSTNVPDLFFSPSLHPLQEFHTYTHKPSTSSLSSIYSLPMVSIANQMVHKSKASINSMNTLSAPPVLPPLYDNNFLSLDGIEELEHYKYPREQTLDLNLFMNMKQQFKSNENSNSHLQINILESSPLF